MDIEVKYLKAAALFTDEKLGHKHAGVIAKVHVTVRGGRVFLWSTNERYAYLQYLGEDAPGVTNVCISPDEIKILKGAAVSTGHKYFEEATPRTGDMLSRAVLRSLTVDRDAPAVCDFNIEQLSLVWKAAKTLKHSQPSNLFVHRANDPNLPAVIQIEPTVLVLAMPLREADRKTFTQPAWLPPFE